MTSTTRRIVAVLTVLIGAFGVIGLAGAQPALASNCTFIFGQTYYASSLWHFQTQAQSCTGVDEIQVQRLSPVTGQQASGWNDNTKAVSHPAPSGYNLDQFLFGRYGVNLPQGDVVTWNIPPWCAAYGYQPGSSFQASELTWYRIHNITAGINTWGSWHLYGLSVFIGC